MLESSDPFGRSRGMYVQSKFGDFRKNKPKENKASLQTRIRSQDRHPLDSSKSIQSEVKMAAISEEQEYQIIELTSPNFGRDKTTMVGEGKVQKSVRDDAERISLESVEGMDPTLLRKKREFLEKRHRRVR